MKPIGFFAVPALTLVAAVLCTSVGKAQGVDAELPAVEVTTPADGPKPSVKAPKSKPKSKPRPSPEQSAPPTTEAAVPDSEFGSTDDSANSVDSAAGRASASPGRGIRSATTAVSIVTEDAFEAYGVSNPYEALIGTPNLTPVPAGGEFLPPIRGIQTGGPAGLGGGILFGTLPSAPIIVDDVARNSNLSNSAFQSTFDLDYVEVLRGPQLSLPGALGFAGAFVVKTKGPSFEYEAQSFTEYSWNDISGPTYRVAGMANAPIVANELAVRLVAEYEDGNAPFVVADPTPGNPFGLPPAPPGTDFGELNDFDSLRLRGKLLATPSSMPGLSVLVTGEYEQGLNQVFDSFINGPELTGKPIEDRIYAYGNQQILDTETFTGIVNIAYQLSPNSELRSITSYINDSFTESPRDNAVYISYDMVEDERFAQDFVYSFGTKLTANGVIGATFAELDRKARVSGFSITQDNSLSQQAVYADTSIPVFDRWRVIGGGRIQRNDNQVQSTFFDGFGTANYSETDLEFLPKAGLSYDLSATETLLGTVRRGYNPGGSTISFSTLLPYEWEAERVWTYELGYRGTFWGDALSISATAFYNDYTDKQFYVATTGFDTIILNEPEARSYGLELEGRMKVTQAVDVFFGLGLLDTKITKISPDSLPEIQGNRFGLDPRATVQFGATYRPFDGFALNGKVVYVSEYSSEIVDLPGETGGDYALVDLAASYTIGAATIRGFVNNVTDEFAVYQGLYTSQGGAYVLPPRTLGLSLDLKF